MDNTIYIHVSAIAILILLATAYKNLPWVWHIRFFRLTISRLYTTPTPPTPACLFLPAISSNLSPLSECDYNIHKSNSTYFSDVDISRGNLTVLLFGHKISARPGPNRTIIVLGGVQCTFRREIRPYEPYEVWSRVLSWDQKWLYVVSHFVERGIFIPETYLLRPGSGDSGPKRGRNQGEPREKVFASFVSRYVFKQGRITYPPEDLLRDCGLLSSGDEKLQDQIEEQRRRGLEAAQLRAGWEAVHESFDGNTRVALGRYMG